MYGKCKQAPVRESFPAQQLCRLLALLGAVAAVIAPVAVLCVAGVFAVIAVGALEVELVEGDADDVYQALPDALDAVASDLVGDVVGLDDIYEPGAAARYHHGIAHQLHRRTIEIGRASCRERG